MSYAWRETVPGAVFSVAWVIDAPWAHPLWRQYLAQLYDLTTPAPQHGPVTLYLPDATHEFLVHALDPDSPIPRDAPIQEQKYAVLTPANYGYQFRAESNDAAAARVQELVDAIVAGNLSPDTDFRSLWDKLWADAAPLVRGF